MFLWHGMTGDHGCVSFADMRKSAVIAVLAFAHSERPTGIQARGRIVSTYPSPMGVAVPTACTDAAVAPTLAVGIVETTASASSTASACSKGVVHESTFLR